MRYITGIKKVTITMTERASCITLWFLGLKLLIFGRAAFCLSVQEDILLAQDAQVVEK
jgi:hypothetical protein